MNWQAATSKKLKKLVEFKCLGLVTDMDGTISPIVADPADAQVTPRNLQLLQDLRACLHLVAVISGRGVSDIAARVGLSGVVYVGNHGLETWAGGETQVHPEADLFRPNLLEAINNLEPSLVPGVVIEDKGVTFSIHYRQTADPEAVKDRLSPIVSKIAKTHDLDFFPGRMVFELRPPVEVDKGRAFRRLVSTYDLQAALFIGDDVTDLAAIKTARELRLERACYSLGVGVLSSEAPLNLRSAADFLVHGVDDVEEFLTWLLNARRASAT